MSRGPGEIEKALEAVFKDSDDELTTRQLGCLFPERLHRAADTSAPFLDRLIENWLGSGLAWNGER